MLACFLLGGCAAMAPVPHHAQTPCTADAAASIVARASAFLQGKFGAADVVAPEIVRYPDAAALRQALGFAPSDRTAGYYDRAADRIHVACSGNMPLDALLMHEATHRYLHRRFSFRPRLTEKFSAQNPLPSVPPWLQEGLAAWMESNSDDAQMRVNTQRLAEFRQMMRRGGLPPLERVLAKGFDDPFRAADYAVAWALVWYLMQDARGIEGLAAYLDAASRGFFNDPEREYPELVSGCADFSEFARAWDKHVSDASTLRGVLSDEDWQREWRKSLWSMKPQVPE